MRRRLSEGILLTAVAVLAAVGCDSNTPTTPTPNTPVPTTETFSGVLTPNGAQTFPFVTAQAGTVTATLTSLGPDPLAVIGISIGMSSGTTCQVVLSNDNSSQGAQIQGAVTGTGTLCARVYDSSGKLTEPVTFTIAVDHF